MILVKEMFKHNISKENKPIYLLFKFPLLKIGEKKEFSIKIGIQKVFQ